jgi:hypothetical protein
MSEEEEKEKASSRRGKEEKRVNMSAVNLSGSS